MTERGVDSCVMEVSSHALSQHRVDGVVYDVALFTNLSQDHLDFHPTMRDYFLAKADLFTPERTRGRDRLRRRRVGARAGHARHGSRHDPDLAGRASTPTGASSRASATPPTFTLSDGTTTLHLRSALPGDFNRVNTAMAALALLAGGVDPPTTPSARCWSTRTCPAGWSAWSLGPGREPAHGSAGRPAARGRRLRPHPRRRRRRPARRCAPPRPARLVVVLGAGGDRDRGKRAAMGRAAAEGADLVVVTDDNPRSEDPGAIRAAVLDGRARRRRRPPGCTTSAAGPPRSPQAVRAAHAAGPGQRRRRRRQGPRDRPGDRRHRPPVRRPRRGAPRPRAARRTAADASGAAR